MSTYSGYSGRKTVCWGAPPQSHQTVAYSAKPWLHPNQEWRFLNIVSTTTKAPPATKLLPQIHNYLNPKRRIHPSLLPQATVEGRQWKTPKSFKQEPAPIWKRRGAKPIPDLRLNPVIRGDINWADKADNEELMHIVNDKEWAMTKPDYYEVHSLSDIHDGVVIDPPNYPAAYAVASTRSRVPSLLPISAGILLRNAQLQGFQMQSLISSMGSVIKEYSTSLVHHKRRHYQEILVIASTMIWQGCAGVDAAMRLITQGLLVRVLLVGDSSGTVRRGSKEEEDFIAAGGKVYTNSQDLIGKKFRVVVVAFEDQYSGRSSTLSRYGDWLQHAVVVFVDPPILKSSYTTALQIATRGCYNMCQKTILLVPFFPKPYILDNFVEVIVVDGGISHITQIAAGLTSTVFPKENGSKVECVVPVEYSVKGSRLHFYENGQRVVY